MTQWGEAKKDAFHSDTTMEHGSVLRRTEQQHPTQRVVYKGLFHFYKMVLKLFIAMDPFISAEVHLKEKVS